MEFKVKIIDDFIIKNVSFDDRNIKGEIIIISDHVVTVPEFYFCREYNCYIPSNIFQNLDEHRNKIINDIVDVE